MFRRSPQLLLHPLKDYLEPVLMFQNPPLHTANPTAPGPSQEENKLRVVAPGQTSRNVKTPQYSNEECYYMIIALEEDKWANLPSENLAVSTPGHVTS